MHYPLIAGNLLMAAVFAFKLRKIPPQIPLFYSRPWGEYQLTDWWFIFLLPILMNLLYFLNLYLSKKFFGTNHFVKTVIKYLNLFIVIVFTFVFIKILLLIS